MEQEKYHPEKYWTKVGERIKARSEANNVIAGDDEPYYRYKRRKFLDLMNEVSFSNKSVLEVGCGPGGNLVEIYAHKPSRLVGVDISEQMVELAKNNVPENIEIIKTNGTKLPFKDKTFDIVFSATVLQHNTNKEMLIALMQEMCRVSTNYVYLFERIEDDIRGDDLCLGRPVSYYQAIMNKNGFKYISSKFINVRVSYYFSGAIRKGLNSSKRQEGEPLNWISNTLQTVSLPITSLLDKVFTSNKDIAKLEFIRKEQ